MVKVNSDKEIAKIFKKFKPCIEASKKQREILFFGPMEHATKISKAKTQKERMKIAREEIKKTFNRNKDLAVSSAKCLKLILPLVGK